MTVARTGTDASWPRRRGTCWGRGGRGRHGTSKEVRGRRQAVALGPDAKVVVVASRRSRPRFGFGGVGVTGRGRGHGRCCCCPASRLLVHVPRLDAEDVAARWGAGRGRHGVGVAASRSPGEGSEGVTAVQVGQRRGGHSSALAVRCSAKKGSATPGEVRDTGVACCCPRASSWQHGEWTRSSRCRGGGWRSARSVGVAARWRRRRGRCRRVAAATPAVARRRGRGIAGRDGCDTASSAVARRLDLARTTRGRLGTSTAAGGG